MKVALSWLVACNFFYQQRQHSMHRKAVCVDPQHIVLATLRTIEPLRHNGNAHACGVGSCAGSTDAGKPEWRRKDPSSHSELRLTRPPTVVRAPYAPGMHQHESI